MNLASSDDSFAEPITPKGFPNPAQGRESASVPWVYKRNHRLDPKGVTYASRR